MSVVARLRLAWSQPRQANDAWTGLGETVAGTES